MIDDAPSHITYHSTFRLTTVTIVLCISTYYYGFILTNLATFSTQTILEANILLFRFMGKLQQKVRFGG